MKLPARSWATVAPSQQAGWPDTADASFPHTPCTFSLLGPSSPSCPEKGERPAKRGRSQPHPLTIQRTDATSVTAARIPCGELQSHPDIRRPFELIHHGQEDFGWHWDLQGE